MITAASEASGVTRTQSTQVTNPRGLDRDDFLKLLITQMGDQDPLDPTDNTEFIAQLAQFSSLEQMQNMNRSIESFTSSQPMLAASALIGRTVTAMAADGSGEISGRVTGLRMSGGNLNLAIGDRQVPYMNLVSVSS